MEIDAWDNSEDPDEPKVTHGKFLDHNSPFNMLIILLPKTRLDSRLADRLQSCLRDHPRCG